MGVQDFIVGPIYMAIILIIGYRYKESLKDDLLKSYFIKGLGLKIIGAIGVTIIYFVYYKSGDTVFYFKRAKFIDSILINDFYLGLKLLFANPAIYDSETYGYFTGLRAFDMSSFIVVRMCAITNLLCFDSYLANALIFSSLSYIGIWRLFKLTCDFLPKYKKVLAWGFLFMPSVFFWGSGVLKDNVTMGFLCLFLSAIYYLIVERKSILKNVFYVLLSVYIIGVVKSYILLAAIPAIFVWLFFQFKSKVKSPALNLLITPVILVLMIPMGYGSLQLMGSSFSKFSLDNAQEKAEDMQRWHTYRVEVLKGGDGSSYNLGHVEFTPIGILSKIPAAINVAIFRPYLWEVRNPIMLLSALESFFLLLASINFMFLFLRMPGKALNFLSQNPFLYLMLVFSLILGFSVGFTSYNFGALSRYRIPILPFFLSFILILVQELKSYKKTP